MIIAHKPRIIGTIEYMHGRNGQILRRGRSHNGITTAGFNYMLDCMFGAAVPVSQLDPWYIGLINNTPSPTLLATDTLVSHSGWVELVPGTAYTGNRQTWADADAALSAKSSSLILTSTCLCILGFISSCRVYLLSSNLNNLLNKYFSPCVFIINSLSCKIFNFLFYLCKLSFAPT